MRKHLKRYLPDHRTVQQNRWLRCLGPQLTHPRLWHLNRHSVAGGLAAGLFCGLVPGPFQMFCAALAAILFRVNLPLAMVTTLYTNPFTLVPLYLLAFQIGSIFEPSGGVFVAPPEFSLTELPEWTKAMGIWVLGLGKPLGIGLVILATLLAVSGYFLMRLAWRIHLVRAWRRRHGRRPRA
ncbi:DUF2062 domain-containing protein [Azovibrio restrictus]|uniref:DUF2062 domain-containing protein n=1 Tax=Azovibrio restrictus TaxID=146938 RepID=UPI0026EE6237|nr:DUF2062 domain-containing protein [Azovibrio restrictus]